MLDAVLFLPGSAAGGVVSGVMLRQRVAAKIVFEIAPRGVNVIRVVLRIVEFAQKRGPLDTVIMPDSRRQTAGPGEGDPVHPIGLDPGERLARDFRPVAIEVKSEQFIEPFALGRVELGAVDTDGREC